MPNMMEMLRLKNIFGQPPIQNPSPMPTPPINGGNFSDMFGPKNDPYGNISLGPAMNKAAPAMALPAPSNPDMGYDVSGRMKDLYHPESTATDRFSSMIDQYPNREQYKPSMLRAIAAALTAFGRGGPEQAMQVIDEPFNDKLSDWKNKIGPAQNAATLERTTNSNERTMAYQTISQELRQQADEHKAKMDDTKAKIAQQRADVYQAKAENPNMKFDFKGPTVMITNPKTGEIKDSGIPTGSMSELDKMHLQQDNAMSQIDARGNNASALEDQRQGGRESLQTMRGWSTANIPDPNDPTKQIGVRINQDTGEVQPITLGDKGVGAVNKPGSGGRGSELPTQTKVRQANAARQLAVTHPELAKFIKMGNGNDFTIAPPSAGGFFSSAGPTPEQHKLMQDTIYGADEIPVSTVASHGAPNTPNTTVPVQGKVMRQRSPSTGQIRESTDGGKTWRIVSQ